MTSSTSAQAARLDTADHRIVQTAARQIGNGLWAAQLRETTIVLTLTDDDERSYCTLSLPPAEARRLAAVLAQFADAGTFPPPRVA